MAITKNSQIDLNGNEMILDADGDTTITADTDDQIDIKVGGTDTVVITGGAMALKGATPTLTIGDAGAEDTKIVFDGNAQDFYIGLDDSADDLVIGKGSAVGTTPAISVDENQKVTFTKDIEVQGDSVSGSEGGHITLRAASGGSKEFGIDVDSSNNFRIITEDDGTGDNGAAHVYVTNTGNVGIGQSSPNDETNRVSLELNDTWGGVFQNSVSGTPKSEWRWSTSGATIFGSVANEPLAFYTNNTERMRISSAGNVAIGTTDTSDVRLRVDQNQNDDYTAFFKNTCAANAVVGVTYSTGETVNAANKFGFQVLDNSNIRFEARMNGDVFSSTNSYSSDIRLKENIKDCEPMLEKLRQVRIVDFDWKDGKGPDGRQRGVIAQEIEPIFPELIHEPVEYKEFKKSEMMPILVKAIQEQQEQIEDLQSEINTLKGG